MTLLAGKKIVLGITGGIAAYKAVHILRRLTADFQADVQVVMTSHALEFMTPLIFETFSGKKVLSDMFASDLTGGTHHIDIIRSADLILVAPATANIVGKVANGIADDLLSTMLMVAEPGKTYFALAMNSHMYLNPFFQKNKHALLDSGYKLIEPETGALATQYEGQGIGRLAEESQIVRQVVMALAEKPLQGKKIIVTAGPTREYIDAVRFISNPSTGKMGFALAETAQMMGADVHLIAGPNHLTPPPQSHYYPVTTANEMMKMVGEQFDTCDALIMTAAVEDIRPKNLAGNKIKKGDIPDTIAIEPSPDILLAMGQKKTTQLLIGFSVEVENELDHSIEKLKRKNLDYIIVNNPTVEGAGFASDTNKITVVDRFESTTEFPQKTKKELAEDILRLVFGLDRQ